jgi:hypothetical protein
MIKMRAHSEKESEVSFCSAAGGLHCRLRKKYKPADHTGWLFRFTGISKP